MLAHEIASNVDSSPLGSATMYAGHSDHGMRGDVLDEHALLVALRAGHEWAFETMVRTFGGRLLAVARRFTRNEEDAQDIVQSAYLNAFRALGQFEGTAFNPVSGQPDMTSYIASEFMPGGAHNYGWSKEYLGAAFDLAQKQKNELNYDKRQAITHDWQKAMAENMPTIPVQGERSWTQFSFAWPKLQNYKAVAVNGPDGTYGVLYENYWYDKSKDKA